MALQFPANPTVGQTYISSDYTYAWDGVKWTSVKRQISNVFDTTNHMAAATSLRIGDYAKVLNPLSDYAIQSATADIPLDNGLNAREITQATAAPITQPRQTGDGVKTTFDHPAAAAEPDASFFVTIDGIYQTPTITYVAAANGINFTEAPPSGAAVDVMYFKPVTVDVVPGADLSEGTVSASGSIYRTLSDRFSDVVNVKDFGAIGDWNATTQTGSDDTLAIQAAIDYASSLGNPVEGSRPAILLDGSFYATALTIPGSAVYGLDFIGTGTHTSHIWFDATQGGDFGIDCQVEGLAFTNIRLVGTSANGSADRKPAIIRVKKSSGRLDVDIRFSNCVLTQAGIGVQSYGRGVTLSNSIASNLTSIVEIVADPGAVFGTSRNQLIETSMRNYLLTGLRTDGVQNVISIVGTGTHKDHINDIKITNCSFISTSRLILGADATIRDCVFNGNSALSSFSGGVVEVNGLRGVNDTDNVWKNLFGAQLVASTVDSIEYLYNVSNAAKDLTIQGTTAGPMEDGIVFCGSGSDDIKIMNCIFKDSFSVYTGNTARWIVSCSDNISNLVIANNSFTSQVDTYSYRMYDVSNQTSIPYVYGNEAPDWEWDDWRIRFNPISRCGGAINPQNITYGRMTKDSNYVNLTIQVGIAEGSLQSGVITIDIPSNAPIAITEYSSSTSTYSGSGSVTRLSNFTKPGYVLDNPNVNPATQRIELKVSSGLVQENLSDADYDGTGSAIIFANVRYRYV